MRAGVEDAGDLQDLEEPIVRAMNVADGDDAIDAVPFTGTGGGKRARTERDNSGRDAQRPSTRDSESGHDDLFGSAEEYS
jgi:hypothetical protein